MKEFMKELPCYTYIVNEGRRSLSVQRKNISDIWRRVTYEQKES
jgi:hypothetical protein